MIDRKLFEQPGEHSLSLDGNVGLIEASLTIPTELRDGVVAILGHPHSLQGGSMTNKVVTTMARTFRDLGIASLRFNFRGVGQSEGSYDAGIGESEDMLKLLAELNSTLDRPTCFIAGFSFGSYVAYRAACQTSHHALITIAPPVHHYDYTEFKAKPKHWIVFQGDEDEVVPKEVVEQFFTNPNYQAQLEYFKQTGHFFHGKLVEFKNRLKPLIEALL